MDDKKSNSTIQIIVAIIGATAVCIAAIIGILQPLVSRLVDNNFPTNTPLSPISLASQTPNPVSIVIPTNTIVVAIQTEIPVLLEQPPTPIVTNGPSPSSYAIDGKTLKPEMSISGPATIHPFDGSAELAKAVGLDWIPRWGINIPTGVTIQIPQTVTLLSGKTYIPDGYVDIYTDDARMAAAQKCWLINNP